ncbi:MAG TPA: lysophospholipid acyltransferase family protein [Phnomibacter sp.]|nr:lysophospholipid acyltransferase family protein [Phnomibacter sp.]
MPSIGETIRDSKLVKGPVYSLVGLASWPGLSLVNKTEIRGMEHLENLPAQNVLFVSNHQTYFADVITFLHIFCARNWGRINKLGLPFYLLWPFTRVKFIAAEETMKNNWLSRLFALAGAISVKRTWRAEGKEVKRTRDESDTQKIDEALQKNWVITFPQGTTKPFAPGRKGTAHIIKNNRPVVVPVVINGFWRAFDKKGLRFKKKGSTLSITFKEPLQLDYDAPAEDILNKIMDAIEQSKDFMMRGKHHLMNMLDK